MQGGITTFSTSTLEFCCLWKNTLGPNIKSCRLWSPTFSLLGFWCNSFRELYWINPRDADTFASRSDTNPAETRACPKNLKQGAKRERRIPSSDICITELWGPLSCLQIKGPLDSSHQTPSSRTPPLISDFTYPPRKGHYADTFHDLFLGLAAMEGSGSTWKCGPSREFGVPTVLLWKMEMVQGTRHRVLGIEKPTKQKTQTNNPPSCPPKQKYVGKTKRWMEEENLELLAQGKRWMKLQRTLEVEVVENWIC